MFKKLSTTLFISLLFTGTALSDSYIVQKTHTDGYSVAGTTVPANENESTIWAAGDKIRINSDKDTSILMRLDKKMVYVIYNNKKKYSELNLEEMQKQIEEAKSAMESATAESGVPNAFASMMNFSAEVKPAAETKKVGKWNCKKYDVTLTLPMGSASSAIWASTDIKIEYANFAKMKNYAMVQMPGFEKMMKEYEKIKGFPVLTETSTKMMGMEVKTKDEVTDVAEKAAPAGIYDVPSGYKKVDMD